MRGLPGDSTNPATSRRVGVSGKILLIFAAAALAGALVEWRRQRAREGGAGRINPGEDRH